MQQLQDFIERPGRRSARFGFRGAIRPGQDRLDEFQIPVAIHIPDKTIERTGCIVELIGFDRRRDLPAGFRRLVRDPAIERLFGVMRIEFRTAHAAVHFGKARCVPELGAEIAIAFDPLRRQLDVATLRRHGGKREAQGIGAELIDQLERIDDVAFRLRHLGAGGVAHQRVDVDVVERRLFLEMQSHHHHARNPEEDDVEAGDQRRGRIEALQFRRLVRPAQRRERPQRRREPGVEHVVVAMQILAGEACPTFRVGVQYRGPSFGVISSMSV